MNPMIGIDLGTTYSAAARLDADGRPVMIPNAEGELITPSVIWFGSDPPTVGRLAKDEQQAGATDVIAFFKRNMGDDSFRVAYGGRTYSPVDLSALVLSKIKADCEAALKVPVRDAVVTVPAYFTNTQREATIEAARRAGLNVLRIINEPTAAALAYGLHQTGREETVLVYDLGGGTFDVTLVRLTATAIEVLATDGNHKLGGKDWDERILGFFASRFREEHHDDPRAGSAPMGEWMYECERYKRQLSGVNSVKVAFTYEGQKGSYELTREKFAEITADLVDSTGRLVDKVLAECQPRMSWEQLSGVLLVGGSTRMPMIHEYLRQKSGKPPRGGIEVDHAVALGAAIQAGLIARERQLCENPATKPEEIIHVASSRKSVRDVMGHSLGLITESADMSCYVNSKIIRKNLPIPCTEERPYQLRTSGRRENVLDVYITQGESSNPRQCTILNLYRFSNITHVQGQNAVLNVSYQYDANGVIKVSATERSTGRTLPMTVEPIPQDMSWLDAAPVSRNVPAHATIYLCIDQSGSMSGSPLAEAKRAAKKFVSESDLAHCSIGITSFADLNAVNISACQDGSAIHRAIDDLEHVHVGGGTSASPFGYTAGLLRSAEGPRYIISLTDGCWSDQELTAREASACSGEGIEIVAIGFGGADQAFLKRIATRDEGGMLIDLNRLVETFSSIAQAITEQSGSGALVFKGN